MTIKDLIKQKDYDYIELRELLPEEGSNVQIFIGACKSVGGELISLDGDYYSRQVNIVSYEEWSTGDIKNGLTIIC